MAEQDLEGRIARLEATVEAFVTTVRGQFDNTNEQFESLYKHIDGLRDAIQQRDRTPWANLIGAGALLMGIVAMGANGYIRDLTRLETKVDREHYALQEHISDGHPETVEKRIDRELEIVEQRDTGIREWIRAHDARRLDVVDKLTHER